MHRWENTGSVSSCSCSIKRWLLPEINRHGGFEGSVTAQPTVSAENSYSSTFWHPYIYAEQISTIMAFYLFGFAVRMMWMLTVYVQLLSPRLCLSFSLLPPIISFSLLSSHVTFSVWDIFSSSVRIRCLYRGYHLSTLWQSHLNVSNICQLRWNM